MDGSRAWSLLTIEGARQYGGNTGYRDDPASVYRYDSDVANHLQVKVGDLVIVRTRSEVLGVAEVEDIEQGSDKKDRQLCPECGAINIKQRQNKQPTWRCKVGHEFEEPISKSTPVDTFAAWYGKTFRQLENEITTELLQAAVMRPSDQMSIRELDLTLLEVRLMQIDSVRPIVKRFVSRMAGEVAPDTDDTKGSGSFIQERRKVLREIALRRGQAGFRKKLIQRYGGQCQISSCRLLDLLEAAHIDPYSSSSNNGVRNGLLLRSDLHTLFDLGLLGVAPKSLIVSLNPSLLGAGYGMFEGRKLSVNGTSGPGKDLLVERWEFFQSIMK